MTGTIALTKNPLLFNLILFIAKTDDGMSCSGWCYPKKNRTFTITSSFWTSGNVMYLKTRTYEINTASWSVNTMNVKTADGGTAWYIGQAKLENSSNSPLLSQSNSIAITQAIGWY